MVICFDGSFILFFGFINLHDTWEKCMKHVATLLGFFGLKSDPRVRWRAGEDTAECHGGIMLAIISSHHMWCHDPWTRMHTFGVFPSIEMPPVSISMLHTATEKAHKWIGRKSKQINQSMSGGSAVMSNFPWTSLSREAKLLHVYACM